MKIHKIKINTKSKNYSIFIGPKLINKLDKILISQKISVADPIKYRQSLMDSVININAISASLEFKVDELKKVVNQYELELGSLPEKILDYTRLTRDLNIHTETYKLKSILMLFFSNSNY